MYKYFLIVISISAFIMSTGVCFASTLQDGINAYNYGKYSLAESKFKSILKSEPGNVNVRYYLAISQAQQGKFTEAKSNYQYIMAKSPNSQAAHYARFGLSTLNSHIKASLTKVTLDVEEHSSVMVVKNVIINDTVKTNFIVDTGATFTIINTALAKKLGLNLNNAQTVKLMTGNGLIKASKTYVKSIEVGGLTVKNVEVAIADMGTSKELPGLLGMSFLKNFKVTIDKSAGKLTLEKN